MKNLFEITKRGRRPNYSMNTPAGADYARGIAFIESLTTAGQAALADGTAPIVGFITRQSLQTGPILDDAVYPNRIELPFKSGEEASFEDAEEIEAEGGTGSAGASPAAPSYVLTTTGAAIAGGTAIGTLLSFSAGMFQVAQAGQVAEFVLVELQTNVVYAGNIRIRARRYHGDKQ